MDTPKNARHISNVSSDIRTRIVNANIDSVKHAQTAAQLYTPVKNQNKREEIARAHVVLEEAIALLSEYKDIFRAKQLIATCVQSCTLVKPRLTGSGVSLQNNFDRVLRSINKETVRGFLLPKPSMGNQKFSKADKEFIIALATRSYNVESRPSWRMVFRDMVSLLIDQGIDVPNQKTLALWVRKEVKLIDQRIGATAFRRKYNTSLQFEPPKNPSDCWQIDSSRISKFYYNDKEGKMEFLTLCIVTDVYSRKVVGIGIGKSEDHALVHQALRYAVRTTGHLPMIVIGDHSGVYKHPVMDSFFTSIKEKFGVVFRMTPPNSPESKAHIESCFNVIQKFFDKIPGHVGKSPRSKLADSRLSAEAIYKHSRAAERWTAEQVKAAIYSHIREYNRTSFEGRPTADQLFDNAKHNHSLVPIEQQAYLFWKTYGDRLVRRGTIEIQHKKHSYRFSFDDPKSRIRLEGKRVIVKVDADESELNNDWGQCYVFYNDEFACIATKIDAVRYLDEERNDQDNEQLALVRNSRKEFSAFVKGEKKRIDQIIGGRIGEDIYLENYLSNDKPALETARDKFELQEFMASHGISNEDRQMPKKATKIVPIKALSELQVIKLDEKDNDTELPIVKRSRWDFD